VLRIAVVKEQHVRAIDFVENLDPLALGEWRIWIEMRNARRAEDDLLAWLAVDVGDDEIPPLLLGTQEVPLYPISIEGVNLVECAPAATLLHCDRATKVIPHHPTAKTSPTVPK
jgi:hypothetical protein